MSDIVPFGKYKGKPAEALRGDPGYCEWLLGQGWAKDRFPGLIQIIANNFGEPSETPEHNKLQTQFLDREFCFSVVRRLIDFPGMARDARLNAIDWFNKEKLAEDARAITKLEADIELFEKGDFPERLKEMVIEREFEVSGWDVRLSGRSTPYGFNAYIELKPSLGDEYPSVLRQMKANERGLIFEDGKKALIVEEFTAVGASPQQIVEIFAASKFSILKISDLT